MEKFLRKKKDLAITGNFAKWYDKNSREHRRGELAGSIQDGAVVLEVAPDHATFLSSLQNWAIFISPA